MNDILDEAIKERDEYLQKHPHLKPYQEEIDRILSKTPANFRFGVVSLMMVERLQQLGKKLHLFETIKK